MIYCFDIDGTICTQTSDYVSAVPNRTAVDEINRLYDNGHKIIMMTARGSVSGVDHSILTKQQLDDWGVRYHELIMNRKPHADVFIDDRGMNVDDWLSSLPVRRGVVAGAFDIIHPGYISMLSEAKSVCTHLTIALHDNPSYRGKPSPVLSVQDRESILRSIRYVDDVMIYESEKDLYDILNNGNFDIRFLGEDYIGRDITGADLGIDIHWVSRSHGHSATRMKKMIAMSVIGQ